MPPLSVRSCMHELHAADACTDVRGGAGAAEAARGDGVTHNFERCSKPSKTSCTKVVRNLRYDKFLSADE